LQGQALVSLRTFTHLSDVNINPPEKPATGGQTGIFAEIMNMGANFYENY